MAHSGKLIEIEKLYGEPRAVLIPRIINEEGSILRAAQRLDVAPHTIRYCLKQLGLRVESRMVAVVVPDTSKSDEVSGHE